MNGTGQPGGYSAYHNWIAGLRVIMVQTVAVNRFDEVNAKIMQQMDIGLMISNEAEPDVLQWWLPLGIRKNYTHIMQKAEVICNAVGRVKYIKPIYQALVDSGQQKTALAWFNHNKGWYHPYTVDVIGKIVGAKSETISAK